MKEVVMSAIALWFDLHKPITISAYHHLNYEFDFRPWRSALNITLCDKVFQRLVTDLHEISDILLKVMSKTND